MNEESDFIRYYTKALISKWYLIVSAAVIVAVISFIIGIRRTPIYSSTALVVISEPSQQLQFDPRIRSIDEDRPVRAFPEIALSDEVLENLFKQVSSPNIETVEQLHGMLSASLSEDPRLLRLTSLSVDPEQSTEIANAWAEIFVERVNDNYSNTENSELLYFENQLEESERQLNLAEQERINFQAQNRVVFLGGELTRLTDLKNRLLTRRENAQFLLDDIQAFKEELAERTGTSDLTLADKLTGVSFQLKTYRAETNVTLPFQFDSVEDFNVLNKREQIALLDELSNVLNKEMSRINQYLEPLEPQILSLQKEITEINTEGARISRNKDIVEETYLTLARKVDEERIASHNSSQGVLLASKASVPTNPSRSNSFLRVIMAGAVGFFLAVFLILAVAWWRQEVNPEEITNTIDSEPEPAYK